jgi:hypothetical protein
VPVKIAIYTSFNGQQDNGNQLDQLREFAAKRQMAAKPASNNEL